jgi:hypothetical protein
MFRQQYRHPHLFELTGKFNRLRAAETLAGSLIKSLR